MSNTRNSYQRENYNDNKFTKLISLMHRIAVKYRCCNKNLNPVNILIKRFKATKEDFATQKPIVKHTVQSMRFSRVFEDAILNATLKTKALLMTKIAIFWGS